MVLPSRLYTRISLASYGCLRQSWFAHGFSIGDKSSQCRATYEGWWWRYPSSLFVVDNVAMRVSQKANELYGQCCPYARNGAINHDHHINSCTQFQFLKYTLEFGLDYAYRLEDKTIQTGSYTSQDLLCIRTWSNSSTHESWNRLQHSRPLCPNAQTLFRDTDYWCL